MSTSILEAGQNINLTGDNPLLHDIVIGFGWDVIPSNSPDPEIVPMVLLLGENGKVVDDNSVAFFNQLSVGDGAVQYIVGDDQEQVDINLPGIPDTIAKLVFLLFVNPDLRAAGTFRSIRNAYVAVNDRAMNGIATGSIPTGSSDVNVIICGELYRHTGNWKYRALGDGYLDGITSVARDYGFTL